MSAVWSTQPTFSAFNSFCVFKVHSSCPCFVSDGWLSGAVNIHLAEEFAAPVFETATISLQSTGQASPVESTTNLRTGALKQL